MEHQTMNDVLYLCHIVNYTCFSQWAKWSPKCILVKFSVTYWLGVLENYRRFRLFSLLINFTILVRQCLDHPDSWVPCCTRPLHYILISYINSKKFTSSALLETSSRAETDFKILSKWCFVSRQKKMCVILSFNLNSNFEWISVLRVSSEMSDRNILCQKLIL